MSKWDESKKFWFETFRTVILGILGTIAVIIIVDPFKNKTAYDAEIQSAIEKEKLTIKSQIVEDYIAKSYTYTSWASDACEGDSIGKAEFKGAAFGNYRIAQNKMWIFFSDSIRSRLKLVALTEDSLKVCIDTHCPECETLRKRLKSINNDLSTEALKEIELLK